MADDLPAPSLPAAVLLASSPGGATTGGTTTAESAQVLLRPPTLDDASALCEAQRRNHDHLRPWDPRRAESWFTVEEQAARLRDQLERREAGQVYPWVLVRGDRLVGAVNLNNVVAGPFRSASMGYWIDRDEAGRGLATAAVRAVCRLADEELRLHRIEASTLLTNAASRRVLAKCGFEPIGRRGTTCTSMAPGAITCCSSGS
jgi:ribosomal-protein-alanine N-acetyltransferase